MGLDAVDAYNRRKRDRFWASAIFLAWCALTLYAVAHHEPWRDEADSWLIARDRSLGEIWDLLPNVGMPILLYLVYMPFAKLGFSYDFMFVAHWPLAAGAVALVLFRSPFSLLTRTAMVFTYFLAFEYAVVARFYGLTCLFIFALCVLSKKRYDGSPWLAAVLLLLPSTSGFGVFFAAAWGVVWVVDVVVTVLRGKVNVLEKGKGIVITTLAGGAGGLLAYLQLFPEPADPFVDPHTEHWDAFADAASKGLIPYGDTEVRYALAALSLVLTLWLLRRSPRALGVLVIFTGFVAYLIVFIRVGQVRHWGMFLIGLIACRWLALADAGRTERDEVVRSKLSLVATLLLGAQLVAWCVAGFDAITDDLYGRYSNAKEMARQIRIHHYDKRPIAAWPSVTAEAVLPYLPGKAFYYPAEKRFGTHMVWNGTLRRGDHNPSEEMLKRARRQFKSGSRPMYLTTRAIPPSEAERLGLHLVHEETIDVVSENGEGYWLFENAAKPPVEKPKPIGPELPPALGPKTEPPHGARAAARPAPGAPGSAAQPLPLPTRLRDKLDVDALRPHRGTP